MPAPGAAPRLIEIFSEAVELTSAAERAAYLDRACGGDPALRCRVEGLLGVHGQADGFLESPAAPPTITAAPTQTEDAGTVIGLYKLMEPIGEGGMGVVYVAEQSKPVRRKVALKIIKPGMDTKQVIARFEAERQALALMDHPNIARVLDAGATESGRPYFVMELVRGIPITDYCDREQLSIPERLELFVLVCRAVQHAHQKGIIHRDIKPSNVLVTLHDGVPVPKVIDFGIAKATGQSLTDKTLYTSFGQLVGTPLYMSPEQAEMSGLDVDTRSDIYSLGVLLYELLTGTTPFDQDTFRTAALDEMRRIIREEEPPKPSTRLSSLGDTLTTVSANRKAAPRHLNRVVRGELDWIVMRALEKDRRRRYETANDFAADVMRYLTDKPVEACPPSPAYRLGKFARRNQAAIVAGSLVVLALVAGTCVSAWQAVRATAAEHRAFTAQHRAEDNLVLGLQAIDELYGQVSSRWQNDLTWLPLPRPFLEKALPFYERFAKGQRVDSESALAHRRGGEILIQLRRYDRAWEALRRAEAILQALRTVDSENPKHRQDLGACYAAMGQLPQAWETRLDFHQKAIAQREELAKQFPQVSAYRKELADIHQSLASWYWSLRKPCGDEFVNRAREIREQLSAQTPGDPDPLCDLGTTLRNLSEARAATGRNKEAEGYSRRALAIHEDLVKRHPTRPKFLLQLAWDCSNLSSLLLGNRLYDEARILLDRDCTIFEGLLNDYPDVFSFHGYLADALQMKAIVLTDRGDRAELERLISRLESLDSGKAFGGRLSQITWHLVQREAPKSIPLAYALELAKRAQTYNLDSFQASHVLGMAYYRAGKWDDAIATLTKANELERNEGLGFNGFFLAMAYQRKGMAQEARSWYDRSVAWMTERKTTDPNAFRYRDEAAGVLALKVPTANGAKLPEASTRPK